MATNKSFIQLADKLKSELQRHKAFAEAAELLLEIGSIEQATDEAQQKLSKVRSELDGYEKNLAHLKATAGADVESAKAEAQNVRSAAQKEAQAMKNDASLEVDGWRQKARDDAARIVAEAKREAEAIANKAARDEASSSLAAMNAKTQYEAISRDVDAKIEELATLEGKIAKAKEAMAKMLGA